jgi:hypothetical protein
LLHTGNDAIADGVSQLDNAGLDVTRWMHTIGQQ